MIVVFDLGGTLMEYKGMPYSWVDYYENAFGTVSRELNLLLSDAEIQKSCEALKSKNARVVYREVEYTPNEVFTYATEHWHNKVDMNAVINSFFRGIELKSVIYNDTIACLENLKKQGIKIAALTDLPTAMPDEIFKEDIKGLLKYIDLYVSSLTCGFRKPNKNGLLYISEYFGIGIQELVFIGDEEKDIKAARNAGCVSILIDRTGDEDSRKDYGQDFTISSLNELYTILKLS